MKITHVFLISYALITFSGCEKETLRPTVETKTVNQLVEDQPMEFRFNIDTGKVDEFGKDVGKLLLFGPVLKKIAKFFANITISGSDGKEVELDSEAIDLSLLQGADTKYIEYIKLKKVELKIKDPKKRDSLKFISKIEVYLDNASQLELPSDDNGKMLLLSFDKDLNEYKCSNKCLDLSIAQLNWKNILFNSSVNQMVLKPKFIVNSVPSESFELAGEVVFSIKFSPGF